MDIEIIKKIVKASGATEGELILVHFWGEDTDKSIANNYLRAISAIGATPFLLQQSRSMNFDIFSVANEKAFDDRYFSFLSNFDAILDIFTYQPIILDNEMEKSKFNLYRKYIGQLFSSLIKCKRFTQIRVPTEANAIESGLDPSDYIERITRAYDIDYDILQNSCLREKERLSTANCLTLQTGEDCILRFDLSGREWHIDAGDGDWPCGEIYIAPIETKTEGTVFFERLYIKDSGIFENVILSIEGGKVVYSNDEKLNTLLGTLTPENTVVCELGFGMNPNITDLCGYTILDEKMINTFHIAIGANHMFGGQNKASIHLDFVGRGQIELIEKGDVKNDRK